MKSERCNRKIATIVLPAILAISVFIALAPAVSASTTYTVHPTDPSANFTSIQAAIDAASAGDSIEVYNSTYHEHVTVNKQLNIYSRDGTDVTIIDGDGSGKCFYVTDNYINICGFTVQNGEYGIYLYDSDYNKITENTASFNKYDGIYVEYYCDNNEITKNTVNSNKRNGIYLCKYNNDNKLSDNTVKSNDESGIKLYKDNDGNEITNNSIELNEKYGIYLGSGCDDNNLTQNTINYNLDYGIYIDSAPNYISQSNVVNGEHIYYFYKARGTPEDPIIAEDLILTKPNIINIAKITLSDSRYVIVRNNTLKNSDKGIHLDASKNSKVINNTVSLTNGGIYLYSSSANEMTENRLNVGKGYGIYLDSNSNDNHLDQNSMNSMEDYGLKVDNIRNYISQTNIANGEHIYHFYKVYGTEENPIIVENLTLTGFIPKVSNMGKITICDSRYITVRNNTLQNGDKGVWMDSAAYINVIDNTISGNGDGIYSYNSNYNKIIGNDASSSTNYNRLVAN